MKDKKIESEVQFQDASKVEPEPLIRKGKCNMCGMCCRAIRLNIDYKTIKGTIETQWPIVLNSNTSKEEIEKCIHENEYAANYVFIYCNWKPIAKKEAFTINPHLKTWHENDEGFYYKCKMLKDNKCTVHGKKPPVCADYPYYGGNLDKSFCFYTADCGYKVDAE